MHWLKLYTLSSKLKGSLGVLRSIVRVIRGIFPLTLLSLALIALIYYVWFWEVSAHANQILFTAVLVWGVVMAILLHFTILTALLVLIVTKCKNNSDVILEKEAEVGSWIETDYHVFKPFFMPFVTVESVLCGNAFETKPKNSLMWLNERVIPKERGRHHRLRRLVTIKDIFGLTSISFVLSQRVEFVIKPAQTQYEVAAFQTRTSGDGYSHPEGDPRGELIEMRRYQAGDPLKLILWKVFARSRKLVVRAPEPAIVEENDMFVYMISGKNDDSAASLARSFLNSIGKETTGDLSFSVDGSKRIAENEQEGISDVIDSIDHRARGGEDLLSVANLVKPGAMQHCFLLVPSVKGAWLEHIKKFVALFSIKPTFVVSIDARKEKKVRKKAGLIQRMFCNVENGGNEQDALNELCDELKKFGTVRVIDISTGAMRELEGGVR